MTTPSTTTTTTWHFLIIEDNKTVAAQLKEACQNFVPEGSTGIGQTYERFEDAIPVLDSAQFDVVILDVKDQSNDSISGGDLFRQLRQRRFVPVVFYTGLPNAIEVQQTTFLRVVEKTKGISELSKVILSIFETGLPGFVRHMENEQRTYMWGEISRNWPEITADDHRVDLVYLLARRLARSLQGDAVRKFLKNGAVTAKVLQGSPNPDQQRDAESVEDQHSDVVHPIEFYIHPGDPENRFACDIVQESATRQYWMILTPSCDFAQENAEHVVLAKCEPLTTRKEYTKWADKIKNPKNDITDKFTRLVQDRQLDRFKFLPSTFFLPNLVVDFQQLRSIPIAELNNFTLIASLDSPFAEATLARFARYFGRLGTPNLDAEVVLNRLAKTLTKGVALEPKPTAASNSTPSTTIKVERDEPKSGEVKTTSPQEATIPDQYLLSANTHMTGLTTAPPNSTRDAAASPQVEQLKPEPPKTASPQSGTVVEGSPMPGKSSSMSQAKQPAEPGATLDGKSKN